ncbi:MAG: VIT family protein [Acidimicrobiia bacterium]
MSSITSHRKHRVHSEGHKLGRHNWIRAGVLGASDGVVSITALLLGVLSAKASLNTLWLTGLSAIVAGAFSMAIGEYVSVASQKDIENANIAKETWELETEADDELIELKNIYKARGLDDALALDVAKAMTQHNALEAHLRDELGMSDIEATNPFQAAYVSFIAFSLGGSAPFALSLFSRNVYDSITARVIPVVIIGVIALAILGYTSARLGGAPVKRALIRIMTGGIAAFVISVALGASIG